MRTFAAFFPTLPLLLTLSESMITSKACEAQAVFGDTFSALGWGFLPKTWTLPQWVWFFTDYTISIAFCTSWMLFSFRVRRKGLRRGLSTSATRRWRFVFGLTGDNFQAFMSLGLFFQPVIEIDLGRTFPVLLDGMGVPRFLHIRGKLLNCLTQSVRTLQIGGIIVKGFENAHQV